jgi:leucyl aminopeptidase
LNNINIFGCASADNFAHAVARAEGNALARELTHTPPNELTPKIYRGKIKSLAKQHGWKIVEHDMKALRKMGAGAFVAVAQGSTEDDAAIVHLKYSPKNAKQKVALVGKGICFDTGGHNLKPARYMHGMHEDMNGSAVALSILLAASKLKLPVQIDCWLAIAQNHIGPNDHRNYAHRRRGPHGVSRYANLGSERKTGLHHRLRHAHRHHDFRVGESL